MTALSVPQIAVVKILIDDLADLDIAPLHLRIDTKTVGDTRPEINLWTQTRTDFERLCTRWAVKPVESRYVPKGQRQWSADIDNEGHRLLLQCVSFAHHTDWEPRPEVTS